MIYKVCDAGRDIFLHLHLTRTGSLPLSPPLLPPLPLSSPSAGPPENRFSRAPGISMRRFCSASVSNGRSSGRKGGGESALCFCILFLSLLWKFKGELHCLFLSLHVFILWIHFYCDQLCDFSLDRIVKRSLNPRTSQ